MTEQYIKLIAAIAPAIILAVMMVRRDKARPEPRGWLFGAVGLGIAAGVAVIVLGMTVLPLVATDSFLRHFTMPLYTLHCRRRT